MVDMSKIWEIIERFKNRCQTEGWETTDHEDLIKRGEHYHNFIGVREILPSTFNSVGRYDRSAVQEGTSYRVVKVSCKAWICAKTPSKTLKHLLAKNPELLRRNAIYDLSQIYMNGVCKKINETTNVVFQKFEKFLQKELGVKLQPLQISIPIARHRDLQEIHTI